LAIRSLKGEYFPATVYRNYIEFPANMSNVNYMFVYVLLF